MRCAVFVKNDNMPSRGRHSTKSKSITVTKISSSSSPSQSDNVSVTDSTSGPRHSTRQKSNNSSGTMMHKPVKSETTITTKKQRSSGGGGRHLQPPSGNNSKLKHECPFEGCPWRFATPYKLRRHIKSHTKETPYQCKECGRGFSVRYNLLMHIQTIHSTPHKYKCPVTGCKEAFHTQPRLNGHLRKIHKKDWKQLQNEIHKESNSSKASSISEEGSSDTANKTTPTAGRTPKWYKCIDCGKEFTSQAKLSAHMKAHSGNFHCSVQGCSRSFQTSDKLAKHLDTSHKSLPCPNKGCNKVFLKQSQLKNHIRVHNSKYSCPKENCNLKFDNEVDYNDHLGVHMGCAIPCPFKLCNLTFPTQKRLELHYRVAHLANNTTGSTTSAKSKENTDMIIPSNTAPCGGTDSDDCGTDDKMATSSDDFVNSFELPYLKVEDIEAVMLEHTSWTTNQIETFLKNLDIEELEGGCGGSSSLKSSLSGYESDSGYSTHEISPMGLPPPPAPVSHHYGSSLSPAITPVTPSPILSMSSASSPTPFCLYQDDAMFLHSTPPTTTSSDHHHFFGTAADLSLLHQLSAIAASATPLNTDPTPTQTQIFQPQALYNTAILTPPTSQTSPTLTDPAPPTTQSKISCIQSVLPPMNNMTDIEASGHNVTMVPNSFCCSSSPSSSTTSSTSPTIATTTTYNPPSINPQCIETASQFDTFLDGYFSIKSNSTAQQQLPIGTTSNTHNMDMDTSSIPASSLTTTLEQAPDQPVLQSPTTGYSTNKSSRKLSSCSLDSKMMCTGEPSAVVMSTRGPVSDGGRLVIAQVLSSPGKRQPTVIPSPLHGGNHNNNNKSSKPTKVRSKGRHHSASASLKSHPKGRKKSSSSSWPKSMNSGNLMAFRNFILGKLKHTSPSPPSSSNSSVGGYPFPTPSTVIGVSSGDQISQSIPSTPSFYSPVSAPSSEDIFSDFGFNPDTLLSASEQSTIDNSCFSPFSHHSSAGGSVSPSPIPISPSPVPVSPNLDASMHFTSLSSLSSSHSPCSIDPNPSSRGQAGNLDIDGFIQCLSVDPMSREFGETFQSSLGEEFCNAMKTDSDPLLGGL